MKKAQDYFNALNHDYLRVHKAKEELFWQNYMGTGDENVSADFAAAETAHKRFISESSRLGELREHIASLEKLTLDEEGKALLHGLQGWYRFFDCNTIEDPQAQALLDEIIQAESALFAKRKAHRLTHINAKGERVNASLGELLTNQANNENEAYRRSSQASRCWSTVLMKTQPASLARRFSASSALKPRKASSRRSSS